MFNVIIELNMSSCIVTDTKYVYVIFCSRILETKTNRLFQLIYKFVLNVRILNKNRHQFELRD